jgi:hypothetical protein
VVDDGVVEERVGTAGITHRQQLQRRLPVSEMTMMHNCQTMLKE